MDNASKALVMAGALFIAVMLISLTIYMVGELRYYAEASSTQALASQREAFNRFFIYNELSNNQPIKGSDVYNIICKAIDINEGWSEQKIEIIYLGSDYSNKSASEINEMFMHNDKELLKQNFHYEYKISQITGLISQVIFTS